MKIGVITHWYDPEGGAAAGPGTIARSISSRGHDVHVVTGFPIYPAGKIFDGYSLQPYMREVLQGVTVHRSPIFPSHDDRAALRMANYLSFAASGSLAALATLRNCDAILVYSTPATVGLPGMVVRKLGSVPYVLQIQDLWPDTVTSSGFIEGKKAKYIESALHRFCGAVYRQAHTVAVTSPGMQDILVRRGVPKGQLTNLPNWADATSFYPTTADPILKAKLGLKRSFIAMYAGNLGEMQSLNVVVDAAARLRQRTDIEFAFVGAGVAEQSLRRQVDRLGLDNVTFVPPQPFSQMADVLALGDVQLVTLKDVPIYRATTPSKLQANLAAGRPIIAAVAGDGGEIVKEARAGYAVAPGSADELAAATVRLAELNEADRSSLGQNARSYYDAHFSETVVGDRLDKLLHAAAASRRGRHE